jgi:hypothetical protein
MASVDNIVYIHPVRWSKWEHAVWNSRKVCCWDTNYNSLTPLYHYLVELGTTSRSHCYRYSVYLNNRAALITTILTPFPDLKDVDRDTLRDRAQVLAHEYFTEFIKSLLTITDVP